MRRVLRWPVPVDDRPHLIGSGRVLLVAAREEGVVEVWTEELLPEGWPDADCPDRLVQAFGTGQPLPDGAVVSVGSCVTPSGRLVWHLYVVPA